MGEPRHEWGDWLREQFDRHPSIRKPADLARAGGRKDNGRPLIDPSTISMWLRGRRPSYELALAAADAFGVERITALDAAGYEVRSFHGGAQVIGRPEDGRAVLSSDYLPLDELTRRREATARLPDDERPVHEIEEELGAIFATRPGISPAEREAAKRIALGSVRAYLETLEARDGQ